jgi:hypothetical protein
MLVVCGTSSSFTPQSRPNFWYFMLTVWINFRGVFPIRVQQERKKKKPEKKVSPSAVYEETIQCDIKATKKLRELKDS